jgi:prepilin-type N-terminal cleavage/methylation domain-containing protein
MTSKARNNKAFTIMEILLVIIIVSVIAVFGLPNYTKSLERTYEREAVEKLRLIHAAQQLYFFDNNKYFPNTGATVYVSAINTNLNLDLMESGMNYNCQGLASDTTFTCSAVRGTSFTVSVDQKILSDTNPCCGAGTCPTLPNCS